MESIDLKLVRNTIVIRDPTLRRGFTVVPNILFAVKGLSHGARLTFVLLLKYAWQEGSCYPGVDRMAKELEVERKAVSRYTQELTDSGLVTVKRRGLGMTNVYYLNQLPSELVEGGNFEADVPSMGRPEVPSVGPVDVPSMGRKEDSEKKNTHNGVNNADEEFGSRQAWRMSARVEKDPDYVQYLVEEILRVCGDEGSRTYYEHVAQLLPDERIFGALSEIKADPNVRNRGAVFTSKVKEYLAERQAS